MELRKYTSSSPRRNSQSQPVEAYHMTTRRASKTTSINGSASTSATSGSRSGSSRRNSMNEPAVKDQSIPAGTLSIDNIIGDDEQRYSKRRRVSMESKTPSRSSQGSQGSQHSASTRSRVSARSGSNLPPIDETPVPFRRSQRNSDETIQDSIYVAQSANLQENQNGDAAEDIAPRAVKRRKLSTSSRNSSARSQQSHDSNHMSHDKVLTQPFQDDASKVPGVLEPSSQDSVQSSARSAVDSRVRRSARLSQSSAEAERPVKPMESGEDDEERLSHPTGEGDSRDNLDEGNFETTQKFERNDHDPQGSREVTPIVASIAEAQVEVQLNGQTKAHAGVDNETVEGLSADMIDEDDEEAPAADHEEGEEEGEDEGTEDAEAEDVDESEGHVEANKSPASAVDSQVAAPSQKGKPQKKLPGRRRHQHANPTVEAALRRQLDLRVTYRAVAKQLKPILAEISKRTLKNLGKDKHYHEKASEHKAVLLELASRRDKRLSWIEDEHSYQKRNLTRTFDEESELRRMRYNAEVADIQDRFVFRVQHDFLMAVRQENQADDENASDDEEDDVIPSLRHVDTRGNVGEILGPAYHKRSRPIIETEKLLDELELRLKVRRELDQVDEEGAQDDPRPFTFLDPSLREGIEHDRQLEQLIEAVDEIVRGPPKPPSPPPTIRNEEATGLQALAAATDLRPQAEEKPLSPQVKQRKESEPENKPLPSVMQRHSSEARPEHRPEQHILFSEHRSERHNMPFPEHRPEQHIPPLYGPSPAEMPAYRPVEYNHMQQYPPPPPTAYWDTRRGPPSQNMTSGPVGLPPLQVRPSVGPILPASGAGTPIKTHFSHSPPVPAPNYGQIPHSQATVPQTASLPASVAAPLPPNGLPASLSDYPSAREEANGASTSQQALPGKAKLLPKPSTGPSSPTARQPSRSRQGSIQDAAQPDLGSVQSGYRPVQRYEPRPSLPPMLTSSENHTTRTRSVSDTFGPILNPEPRTRSPIQSRPPITAQPHHESWSRFRGPDPFRRSTVSGISPGGNGFPPTSHHQSPALMHSRPPISQAPTPTGQPSSANSPLDHHRGPPQLLPRLPPSTSPYGVPPPPMPYHQSPYPSGPPGPPPLPQHHYHPGTFHPAPPGFPQGLPPPPLPVNSGGPPPPGYGTNTAYGNGPPLLPAPGHPSRLTAPSPQPGTPAFAQYQSHGRQDERSQRGRNESLGETDRDRELERERGQYQPYYGPR